MKIKDIKYGQLFKLPGEDLNFIFCLFDRKVFQDDVLYKCVRVCFDNVFSRPSPSTWLDLKAEDEVILLDVDVYEKDKLLYRSFSE